MDGDTEKLVRVFNNLFTNAFKYGAGATKIVVEIEKVGTEAVVVVALHGGYIYAKSNPEWTSFIIHLPLVRNVNPQQLSNIDEKVNL